MEIRGHRKTKMIGCRLPAPLVKELWAIADAANADLTEVVEVLLRDGLTVRANLLESAAKGSR